MMELHPSFLHPSPNPPPNKPLLPPQQHSNRIIIRIQDEPPKTPLSHPQFVAAKSLMYEPPICYYNVSYEFMLASFPIFLKKIVLFLSQITTLLVYESHRFSNFIY